jgi:RNase P subunit RPR2
MQPIDEPEELRRLEDLYARTGDGDLRALADKLDELKEVARHALRAETSKRGLAMETHDAPTDDLLPRDDDVVSLWAAKDRGEAHLIKTALESAGIASSLATETIETVDGSSESPETELVVRVAKSDVSRAYRILARYLPQQEEAEKEYLACCPKCRSPDIVLQSVDAKTPESCPAHPRYSWTCDSCGHQWEDDGVEREL